MSRHSNNQHSQRAVETPEPKAEAHTCCAGISAPSHDDIAKRAYDIYLKTGRKQGQCHQNWQQAEQTLHDQSSVAPQS